MSYIYTDIIPRMPRTGRKKHSIQARADHVRKLEEKAHAEAKARRAAQRELRVLKRVRFDIAAQPLSVQVSLKLINYTPPQ